MRELETFISCGGESRENFVSKEHMTDKDRKKILNKINKELDRIRGFLDGSGKIEETEKTEKTEKKVEKREDFVNHRNNVLYCIIGAVVLIMSFLWFANKFNR